MNETVHQASGKPHHEILTMVEPTPETDRERNLREFAQFGITPIPDEQCTDMGAYVIWHHWHPAIDVAFSHPLDVIRYRARSNIPKGCYAHPEKPVRVRYPLSAMECYDGSVVYMNWFISNDGYQTSWRSHTRDAVTATVSEHSTRDYSWLCEVQPHRMPKEVRTYYALFLTERLRNSRHRLAGLRVAGNYRDLLSQQPTSGTIRMHGGLIPASSFKWVRDRLKAIGQLIARVERDCNDDYIDTDDLIGSLNALPPAVRSQVDTNIIETWNLHSRVRDEITATACGHYCESRRTQDTHSGEVCNHCFDDDYVYCEDTSDYRLRETVYEWDDDNWRTHPQPEEDEEDYDADDDDDDDDSRDFDSNAGGCVRSYSANVLSHYCRDETITVSQYGEFLMGVELEVMPIQGERTEAARHTHRNLCADYAILKNDGSLGRRGRYADGFEIVTAPRGLAEHIERFGKWKPHDALRSWDTGKCGLHVHISSQAFSACTLGKFIEFINAHENDDLIKAIAGRHAKDDDNAQNYCRRDTEMVAGNPKVTLAGKSSERYYMINTTNLYPEEAARLGLSRRHCGQRPINTIELRIFKGTLNKNRLLAQIEFAHAAVMFCRWSSMRELRYPHFIAWLREAAGRYPNLAKWFGVKANTQVVQAEPTVRLTAEV